MAEQDQGIPDRIKQKPTTILALTFRVPILTTDIYLDKYAIIPSRNNKVPL
jgi:hypothetical protein